MYGNLCMYVQGDSMIAAVQMQTRQGSWDPCGSLVFFGGFEFDSEMEAVCLKRKVVEINKMIERNELSIPLKVRSPDQVQDSFLQQLQELAKNANGKNQFVSVNDKFEPKIVQGLDAYLKKNGATPTDTLRQLFNNLLECFFSRQSWSESRPRGGKANNPEPKAKSKAAAKQNTASKAEATPAVKQATTTKTEELPVAATATPNQTEAIPVAPTAHPGGSEPSGLQVMDTSSDFQTPHKQESDPPAFTPNNVVRSSCQDKPKLFDLTQVCNIEGPCTVTYADDPKNEGCPEFFYIATKEGEHASGKIIKCRNLEPLAILTRPGLTTTDVKPPGSDDSVIVPFDLSESDKVVVDFGLLEKRMQVDSLGSAVLKLVEKHGKKVCIQGYNVTVPEREGSDEPKPKRQKKPKVGIESASKSGVYLDGESDFLIVLLDLIKYTVDPFEALWFLKADFDSTSSNCTLRPSGIAIVSTTKTFEMTAGEHYKVADLTAEHVAQIEADLRAILG